MRKILLVAMLIVGLCLSTAIGNCASFEEKDTVTFSGRTGYAELTVKTVNLRFADGIQPGERYATHWWIENTGPCPLDVTVTVTGPSWLTVVFYPGTFFNMGSGLNKQVALTVELPSHAIGSWDHADEYFVITVIFNSKAHGTTWQNSRV